MKQIELTDQYSKQIFRGIYRKLRRIQKDKKFDQLISDRRHLKFEDIKSDDEIFERMCQCVFAGGFRNIPDETWDEIEKEFRGFEIDKVAEMENWSLKEIFENFKEIKNWGKIIACIQNARIMKGVINKHGSIRNYFRSFGEFEKDTNKFLSLKNDLQQRFKYMGKATVYDFLKDIGCECVKPDVHVIRICHRLGLLKENKPSEENVRDLQEIAKRISKVNNSKVKIIDALFWLYGSGYKDVVKKAICKSDPDCDECHITNCPSRKK